VVLILGRLVKIERSGSSGGGLDFMGVAGAVESAGAGSGVDTVFIEE